MKKFDQILAWFNITIPVAILIYMMVDLRRTGDIAFIGGAGILIWFFLEIPFILGGLFLLISRQTKSDPLPARGINVLLAILMLAFIFLTLFRCQFFACK